MIARATPIPPAEERLDLARLEEQIRRRAYELYEQRGRAGGHALDDWLQAETEVFGRLVRETLA